MSYFPHAYNKVFTPKVAGFKQNGTTHTSQLTAGDFAFVSPSGASAYKAIGVADADVRKNPMVIIAQGSYHPSDTIGSHGGYKESIKSKGINPNYVHRFYKVPGRTALNQIVRLGWDGVLANPATLPTFVEGETYHLRVDVKGSPVLRAMNRNLYHTFDAFTGCVTDDANPKQVDPTLVLIDWAKQINEDFFFKIFVQAVVEKKVGGAVVTVPLDGTYVPDSTPATVVAGIKLTVAYVDTKFNSCSWDIKDHYEMEPAEIKVGQLIDETGDPCSGFKQISFIVSQAPIYAQGVDETAKRRVILNARYAQEPFNSDIRRRQIEGIDKTQLEVINTALVDRYFILHSVPRKANPSSTLDNDQYLLELIVPSGSDMSAFTTWFQTYLDSAERGIKLETFA